MTRRADDRDTSISKRLISIIMYHYVRELPYTRYPRIKGLLTSEFKEQLDYMSRFYTFVTVEECLHALSEDQSGLPPNAALLTFDDAYIDHFAAVFPILEERGIQGAFFPPARIIKHHEVLDVNKIHFVLASTEDFEAVKADIFDQLDEHRAEYGLEPNEHYYHKYAIKGRFDGQDIVFIKRLLQLGLELELRSKVLQVLFRKYVSADEEAFSHELYMNMDQIRCMLRSGMYIGSHGYNHEWLGSLEPERQTSEIQRSLEFLVELGCDPKSWVMSYPYGNYNDNLLDILRANNCKMGITTAVDIADLTRHDPLVLPRLDTNDLPKAGEAAANKWTDQVLT
jgi:peptidoglycan/xylan/chitin deacetylase (PgdA/CDA1 family)